MNPQRQLLLGIFFIVALSILAFYTLFLTGMNLFSKPTLMTVYFEDANNLREGDPVQLLGARIGRVKEVTPNIAAETKKRIRTVLSLESEVELLEDATISIRETSLLGGRHVFIDPGTFGGPIKQPLDDGAFYGEVYKNPIASLGDIGKLFNENSAEITQTFLNLRRITDDIAQGKGLLGKFITDPEIASDGREIVAKVRTVADNVSAATDQIKSGKGLVGALLYDEALRAKFGETVDSLRQLSADLSSQDGLLGALIHDSALRQRVTQGIDSFVSFAQKLDQGEGTLAMLMSDKATRDQVSSLIANLSASSEDIKTLLADARAGKGTIGKLLSDDTLYEDARKTFALANRSLEDYREAAPITAFTSVLFAAF